MPLTSYGEGLSREVKRKGYGIQVVSLTRETVVDLIYTQSLSALQ